MLNVPSPEIRGVSVLSQWLSKAFIVTALTATGVLTGCASDEAAKQGSDPPERSRSDSAGRSEPTGAAPERSPRFVASIARPVSTGGVSVYGARECAAHRWREARRRT